MFNPTPQFKVPLSVPAQTQTQTTQAPPAPDPSVERQDGSRAIEVTAMFGDTVLDVLHLDSTTPSGKISLLTWALAGAGWATFLAGAVLAVVGHYGLGSLLLLGGLGLGLSGNMRRRAEQGSPDYALGEASESNLHMRHEAIPVSCFPLVEYTATGHVLNYTPRMGGDMTLGQSRVGLADLVNTGQVQASTVYPGTYRLPIPRDARIKVDIGENTFLVNSVAPARQVTTPLIAQIDWNKQTFTGLSVGVHALALMLVFLVSSSPKTLGIDTFDRGMKMVDVLITPLKEEVPQWLRKDKVQDNEPGQLGKAHKGESGKMGDKRSKAKNKKFGIKGPRDNAKPVMAKRLAEQAARKYGVLGILGAKSGGHLASIFGADQALGNDVVDALGNLQGNSVGSAYGIGGLGSPGPAATAAGWARGPSATARWAPSASAATAAPATWATVQAWAGCASARSAARPRPAGASSSRAAWTSRSSAG